MASRGGKERVFDEMLCFLGEPTFQIPVRSFMDEHCLIFDPDIKPTEEHRNIYSQYNKLIDSLLDAFCQDVRITTEEAIEGITRLNKIPDLHDMFYGLFEQVLAGTDFRVFFMAMAKRNLLIQEQVLAMILATLGFLPESLMRGGVRTVPAQGTAGAAASDKQEEELMQQVIRQQQNDGSRQGGRDEGRRKSEAAGVRNVQMNENEIRELKKERELLELKLQRLALDSGDPRADHGSSESKVGSSRGSSRSGDDQRFDDDDGDYSNSSSSSSRKFDKTQGTSDMPTSKSRDKGLVDADDMRKRQEFLRVQRDKLLALKRAARAEQLDDAERSHPKSRPASARAAKSALQGTAGQDDVSEEDRRKMAMRKAIAERLREEVVDRH